jgi:hypothetical protein
VERIVADQVGALQASIGLIDRSLSPEKRKAEYEKIVREKSGVLSAG